MRYKIRQRTVISSTDFNLFFLFDFAERAHEMENSTPGLISLKVSSELMISKRNKDFFSKRGRIPVLCQRQCHRCGNLFPFQNYLHRTRHSSGWFENEWKKSHVPTTSIPLLLSPTLNFQNKKQGCLFCVQSKKNTCDSRQSEQFDAASIFNTTLSDSDVEMCNTVETRHSEFFFLLEFLLRKKRRDSINVEGCTYLHLTISAVEGKMRNSTVCHFPQRHFLLKRQQNSVAIFLLWWYFFARRAENSWEFAGYIIFWLCVFCGWVLSKIFSAQL